MRMVERLASERSDPVEERASDLPGAASRGAEFIPAPCHCLAVRQAARHITQIYDRHFVEVGLRATQYAVLAILDRAGPIAVHELAQHLVMDRTATGRALRPLERDGLVHNRPGRDARTRALSLSVAGQARLAAARPLWARAQAAFEAQYGTREADALRLSLSRVVGRV